MKTILPGAFLDIKNGQSINNAVISIEGENYIVQPYSHGKYKKNMINLSHLYVMPALIDSHVHLSLNGIDFKESTEDWNEKSILEEKIKDRLNIIHENGIGAIRDGGDIIHSGLMAKNYSNSTHFNLPEIIATGEGIRKKSHYGSFLGEGLENPTEEVKEKLKELKNSGIDQVKVILNGVVSFNEYGRIGKMQFDLQELQYIVNYARKLNLQVMTHVNSKEGIELAISAGVHSIEHGYFITEELLKKMAAKNIYWVPTIAAVFNQAFKRKNKYSKKQLDIITKTYNNQLKVLKKAEDLGVKIGLGTDAGAVGVEHGSDYFTELWLFKQGGLSNHTILMAATCWNREILNINQEKNLGFIGLNDNPFNNLKALQKPEVIIK